MTDPIVIGTDRHGYEHVYDLDRDRIVVLDPRGIDFQEDLGDFPGETTMDWIEHVESKRGPWRDIGTVEATGAIADTFAGGL